MISTTEKTPDVREGMTGKPTGKKHGDLAWAGNRPKAALGDHFDKRGSELASDGDLNIADGEKT